MDGFSNGQIPPKEAIREVRINQNPYAAENEYPGWGGIEIYTQPGSDKWHGAAGYGFNDESLNSRNPFTPKRAPYQQRSFNTFLSGPVVPKRASFAANFNRYASDANSVVNATILDPATLLGVAIFSEIDRSVVHVHLRTGRERQRQPTASAARQAQLLIFQPACVRRGFTTGARGEIARWGSSLRVSP